MATPRDNTEVVRMLRDFKNAIYKSVSPSFMGGYDPTKFDMNRRIDASGIATRLNFSSLDESTKMNLSSSTGFESSMQTPDALKRKLAHAELELQSSKAALKEKETVISMMEPANKKIRFSLEQKLASSVKQAEGDKETITQLKMRLRHSQSEVKHAKNRALELEKEKKIECDKLDLKLLALRQECSDLKLALAEANSAKAETIRRLNGEIGRLELKISSDAQEHRLTKEIVQTLQRENQELTEKAAESISLQEELHSTKFRLKEVEEKIEAYKDEALIVEARQSELSLLSKLNKENQALKEEISKYKDNNIALFQEKVWAFKEKVADVEKKNVLIAKLEVENEMLTNKLAEWQALLDDKGSYGNRSPAAFSRRLSNYQKNEALMTNKISKLSAHCETLEKQNKSLESALEQMKENYEKVKQNAGSFDPIVKRLRQKIFLLTKERDNCRKLIDSYVSENTMSGMSMNTSHIKYLENTIAEYEKILEKSDEEVNSLQQQVKNMLEVQKLLEQNEASVKKLQADKDNLLSKIKEFQQEKFSLEAEIDKLKEGDSEKTQKIIHLRCNPLDTAVQKHAVDFKSLRDENDRLRKRVKVLEEEGAHYSNISLKVEEKLEKEGSDTLLQNLKDQLSAVERQNKLIMDTARSKSREFREVIYRLTGYKVDVPVTGKYKLSHLYSESPDHHLLFEVNSLGVHLLETEYSSLLTDRIETFLQTYDSVPAFLASVTLDLFNQQTHMMERSVISS